MTPTTAANIITALTPAERGLLAGTHEDTPWWKFLNKHLDAYGRQEMSMAIAPELTNEDRQYNSGRTSVVEDLRNHYKQMIEAAHYIEGDS